MIFMFTSVLGTFNFQTQFLFWPWTTVTSLVEIHSVIKPLGTVPSCIYHAVYAGQFGLNRTIKKSPYWIHLNLPRFKFYLARKMLVGICLCSLRQKTQSFDGIFPWFSSAHLDLSWNDSLLFITLSYEIIMPKNQLQSKHKNYLFRWAVCSNSTLKCSLIWIDLISF